MNLEKSLLTAFASWLFVFVNATDFRPAFKHYGPEDGVPSTETYQIKQDREGYLWICTDKGITRFDGREFRVFSTHDGLIDNTYFFCYIDSLDRKWFYSYKGYVSVIDGDSIYNLPDNFPSDLGMNVQFTQGVRTERNKIIYNSMLGVSYAQYSTGQVYRSREPYDPISMLDTNYWIYHTPLIDSKKYERIENYKNVELSMKYDTYFDTELAISSKLKEVFTEAIFTVVFKGDTIHSGDQLRPTKSFWRQGNYLWFGTYFNGVYRLDLQNPNAPPLRQLPTRTVTSILQDHEGGIWFTTLDDGIYYQPEPKITQVLIDSELSNSKIESYAPGSQFSYMTLSSGEVIQIDTTLTLSKSPISDHNIFCVTTLDDSRIIFSKNSTGSVLLNHKTGEESLLDHWFPKRTTSYLDSILISSTFKTTLPYLKIYHYEIDTSWRYDIPHLPIREAGLLQCLRFDQDHYYFSTVRGAFLWNAATESYEDLFAIDPFYSSRINQIARIGDRVVMASKGEGIALLDGQKNSLKINEESGLIGNLCESVLVDGDHTVWVCTNKGVSRITFNADYSDYEIHSWNGSQGLVSNECIGATLWKDHVYLFSPKGISRLQRNQAAPKSILPGQVWDGVEVNGVSHNMSELPLEWNYQDNNFQFRVTGIAFKFNNELRYRYRLLKNGEGTWFTTHLGEFNFADLSPAQYELQVQILTREINERTPLTYRFEIVPPFWSRWPFRLLLVLASLGLVFGVFVFYLRRAQREKDMQILTKTNQLLRTEQELSQSNLQNAELAQKNLELELQNKNQELSSYATLIMQKRQLFEKLNKNLDGLLPLNKKELYREVNSLKFELRTNLQAEKEWAQFEEHFYIIHQEFISKLKADHRSLTEGEIRLCCLIRMNLNNNEIANILNISASSVHTGKYRIKKKLELKRAESLSDFLRELRPN